MSFPAWLISVPRVSFIVAPGEWFRELVARRPSWPVEKHDDLAIWTYSVTSGNTRRVSSGRLVAIGQVDRIMRVGDGLYAVDGFGLRRWWSARFLGLQGLGELVGVPDGAPRELRRDTWNKLIRIDTDERLSAVELEPWLVHPDPAVPTQVRRRPSAIGRPPAGPIERAVLRESARGSLWRPGRGRWR